MRMDAPTKTHLSLQPQPGVSREEWEKRLNGRYYTPASIGERLADELCDVSLEVMTGRSKLHLIDPFCGDGRLIGWWLQRVAFESVLRRRAWSIELWDNDESAVEAATGAVKAAVKTLELNAEVRGLVTDTFADAPAKVGSFDLVLTNPPWERLKPDQRELKHLSEAQRLKHERWLKAESKRLQQRYPWSAPTRGYAGSGINLARAGVELSLSLLKDGGCASIVSPASLFADQVSASLRGWIFRRFNLKRVSYFPAEARLFDGVDQPCATLTAHAAPPGRRTQVTVFDRDLATENFEIDPSLVSEESGHSLPIHGPLECLRLLERSSALPTFGSLEAGGEDGLWAGRELDETRDKHLLRDRGTRPFIKGRMVGRYAMLSEAERFVPESAASVLPASVGFHRIVWRDVSRPTQRRRMQATVIPPLWVTGNSVHVAHFRDDRTQLLRRLLAVVNSLAFEIHVRLLSATAHVSLGTVRKAAVPDLENKGWGRRLDALVERRLAGDANCEPELEALVAKAYGFSRDDFQLLRRGFPKLSAADGQVLDSAFKNL